ncbi:TPA: hypothetical protein MFN34_005246 [Klebsiella pneumoniae]|nr:hypothetical protein [Klebsiella pneumoniae]HBW8898315.1 hypothetical protein [Klebsiella pneumoniae]
MKADNTPRWGSRLCRKSIFPPCSSLPGVTSENGIYGHSRFCNTDFDDKLACLNLSGV